MCNNIIMSYKIVVARYNEQIEWLNSEIDNCIIYNKGDKLHIKNEIMLDNVGRESETYLQYIINNYDCLPDIVVFTQAKISDHRGKDDVNYLLRLMKEAQIFGKSLPYHIHHSFAKNNSNWDPEWNKFGEAYFLRFNHKDNRIMTFIDWFKENICDEYPNPIHLYNNAIFAVKKELILKHTKEWYQELIKQCNHHINPVEGHFFERSWYYIFN
jgi:hypothetical protein